MLSEKVEIRKSFNGTCNSKGSNELLKARKAFLLKDEANFRLKNTQKKTSANEKSCADNSVDEKKLTKNACCIKNQIEKKSLQNHKVKVTTCHGRDLEGNSVRRLMAKGG